MESTDKNQVENSKQDTQISQNEAESQYKIVDRIAAYPMVSSALETAKGYYEAAKDSSNLVKSVAETAESGLSTAMHTIQPVLDNQTVVKPLLTSLDGMAMNQLDRIEKTVEAYQPAVAAAAESIKTKAGELADASVQKIAPIDQYLKESYVGAPVVSAVGMTENLVNRYVKEDKDSANASDESGPIFRSGALALRLQKEALARLSNLSLRDTATTTGYTYVVDLIQYAVTNLDSTIHNVNDKVEKTTQYAHEVQDSIKTSAHNVQETIQSGVEISKEGARLVLESDKVQQTKAQIEQRYHDATHAIVAAIEHLQKQVPVETVTTTTHQVYDATKTFAQQLDETNMALYNTVAAKSAEKLRELSSTLQGATNVSQAAIENARSTLATVLDNLVKIRHGEIAISEVIAATTGAPSTTNN